jgi:hypothetical protein
MKRGRVANDNALDAGKTYFIAKSGSAAARATQQRVNYCPAIPL